MDRNQQLEERILAFVSEAPARTFVELERHLGTDMAGVRAICLQEYPNVMLWDRVNSWFAAALWGLIEKGLIVLEPTMKMLYMLDGKWPRTPLAKGRYHYKEPHWMPVAIVATREGVQRSGQASEAT